MTVAYELVNVANSVSRKELESTIVILDPCINPDGYSRYGNWLREISGKKRILNCQIENIWKYGLEVDTIIIYLT
jgi:hypothetical protein